ncbi:nuclear transport factor 2 family protein [Pseudonocardia sp. HH130629-09]|uniref:nuclear transport factor 2 family protein n=1 Tax=Pseudonocardia sp. HH130629-09 TaxID=1641402 RepID=UPI000760FFF8|nr:nuclear transport factor 2 family protein [Pseudonocardia sp. HH130629-09]
MTNSERTDSAPATPQPAHLSQASLEEKITYLLDRVQIADVVQRYGECTDMRDFARLRTCFVDEIEVDHSPTIGMGRMRVSADRWCELAEEFHSQLDGDEHMLIPQTMTVLGDTASCHVLMHAHHFYRQANGSPFQTLVGTYDMDLVRTDEGWKISRSIQGVHWSEGNWQFHSDIADSLTDVG